MKIRWAQAHAGSSPAARTTLPLPTHNADISGPFSGPAARPLRAAPEEFSSDLRPKGRSWSKRPVITADVSPMQGLLSAQTENVGGG